MGIKIEIIQATCIGIKPEGIPNQDCILIYENNKLLIITVSDGLGSSINSLEGAQLACKVVVDYFREDGQNISPAFLSKTIPQEWERLISERAGDRKDYRTTNSFVIILKHEKKIIIGRLGDVLVAVRVDGLFIPISSFEKEFINETECLGSNGNPEYEILLHDFQNSFELLMASDGIGDELVNDKVELLFDYLKTKYASIKRKKRNYLLENEILQTLTDKNNDDKSLVFAWSN